MEHCIILGGEWCLPFARSRVKALLATGLECASQSFEIDGVSIKVKIVPGHEYIRIDGTPSIELRMDSGLAEAFYIAPTGYAQSPLFETGAYLAPFVPTDPPGKWRIKNSAGSTGQFAGNIAYTKPTFKGRVPYSGLPARSLCRGKMLDPEAPLDKPAYIESTEDGNLLMKKLIIAKCPASIFTGRCRLYVQALYGQFMYADDKLDELGAVIEPGQLTQRVYDIADYGYGTPFLELSVYETEEDKELRLKERGDVDVVAETTAEIRGNARNEYDMVRLRTSSGVHLDPQTGKHWLFNVEASEITVYPLIGSKAAESLRKSLLNPPPQGQTALNEEDREHLEAYILSTCLPRARVRVKTAVSYGIQPSQFGYGWHWNWDGTEAHIVEVKADNDSPGKNDERGWYQSSTHYKHVMTATQVAEVAATDEAPATPATTTFAWSTQIVEPAKKWTVQRDYWCIAIPIWGEPNQFLKATPKEAYGMACDAPFYLYFHRNALKVCRVKVEVFETEENKREASHPKFGPLFDAEYTLGLDSGWQEITYDGLANVYGGFYRKATFTIGDTVLDDFTIGLMRIGIRHDVKDKAPAQGYSTGFTNDFPPGQNLDIYFGRPQSEFVGSPPQDFATQRLFGRRVRDTQYELVKYTYEESSVQDERNDIATIIIPWYDSEAIFVQGSRQRSYGKSGITRTPMQKGLNSWVQHSQVEMWYEGPGLPPDNVYGYSITERIPTYWWRAHGVVHFDAQVGTPTNPDDELTITVLLDHKKLHCRAGNLDAEFPISNLQDFHDNSLDQVMGVYQCASGTSVTSPVVVANTKIAPVGTNGASAVYPALLGWV